MIPGRYPKHVKIMLIRRSPVHPRSRKTPSGGRRMARRILQISLRGRACMLAENSKGEKERERERREEKNSRSSEGHCEVFSF